MPESNGSLRRIAIVLFDGVEELDAVGPWVVLSFCTRTSPGDGWEVVLTSVDGGAVTAAKGMVIGADLAFEDLGAVEVLLHPGGGGTRRLMADPQHLDWVREQRRRVPLTTSVCTGSLVYAAAGLLTRPPRDDALVGLRQAHRRRPQHRGPARGPLRRRRGHRHLRRSVGRYRHGLHLVVRLAGVERARQVRRGIQYDPQPPV